MPQSKPQSLRKYSLYESSVQSADAHAEWFDQIYREIKGRTAIRLREDFCGTFKLCCEWIKLDRKKTALGLDLDPEPLRYGLIHHAQKLLPQQKNRLEIKKQNVLKVTREKFDLIVGCNFSFYVFKERKTLVRYLKACLASLSKDGVLILELAGGPGMIEEIREKKKFREKGSKKSVTYIWDQQSFNPITHEARYAIHFRLPNGEKLQDAFTYDWRLWTMAEVRDALTEAGFQDVCTYWETEHRGEGTGEYLRTEDGDNSHAWIAYAVGIKTRA